MGTLVLSTAGAAAGGLLGPVGAVVGRAAGAIAGAAIDDRLFGSRSGSGPTGKLDDIGVQAATEGTAIARVYGRMRLAGSIIWATRYEETVVVEEASGGKGAPQPQSSSYVYFANFAVAICEGPVARIGRIWADGKLLDREAVMHRIHLGAEDQTPDPLIEARQGTAPGYRGLVYVVFERMPIAEFGNRIPQLSFEVIRPVDRLEGMVRAVTLIPGATEFGYHPEEVRRELGPGRSVSDNRHLATAGTDLEASLDELQALCPRLERVALVVAWFGDDLRAAECRIEPKVEDATRETSGATWGVAGLERGEARLTSQVDGRPAYGGTPSDASVMAAIQHIRARGLKVVFYPFVLMDIPAGNGLPDPYGGAEQAPHPWRGRISVFPAPGQPGSPDKTGAATGQVATILGSAQAADFAEVDGSIAYSGPDEWSLRRMILHYAHLCEAAGGVDAFLIGSELRGLTWTRSAPSSYPFVDGLCTLADDVRGVLRAETKISYAADWSEFFGHQPADGTGDVHFHLDPLWARPSVDFVGIDLYWPLSDWRDGEHLDADIATGPADLAYLSANVAGGEGYDWFYASEADRTAQVRTPITDGAHGKPWVFRYKDLAGWWSNVHVNRPGGAEAGGPTGWTPAMKPVWFTEAGCPAIDRGANQPNVFYDPKSSESFFPHFSSGGRDDAVQRRYLEALIGAFDAAFGSDGAVNPSHPGEGWRMVTADGIHAWTWDARPFPAFPQREDAWSDGPNWQRGHWLNGRFGGTSLAALVRALFADWGLPEPEIIGLDTVIDGISIERPSDLRAVLAPLGEAFGYIGIDAGTHVRFADRAARLAAEIGEADLVDEPGGEGVLSSVVREEASELPIELRLGYRDTLKDFGASAASSRRLVGASRQVVDMSLPAALWDGLAGQAAERRLHARWAERTRASFALPPSRIALEPGDVVALTSRAGRQILTLEEIEDGAHRRMEARSQAENVYRPAAAIGVGRTPAAAASFGPAEVVFLDLPRLVEGDDHRPYVAAFAAPWPGSETVWRSVTGEAYEPVASITGPAILGRLVEAVAVGPLGRWDRANAILLELAGGRLEGRADLDVLAGANALAVEAAGGDWEIVQFAHAELVGERRYRLSRLLRGQLGTEDVMVAGHPAGSRVVLLSEAVTRLPLDRSAVGLKRIYRIGPPQGGIAGTAVVQTNHAASARGLLPLSPVHARGRRRADGALVLTWIRRTRIGGDDWMGEDVPLGETAERYRLEILDGGEVVRTVETVMPSYAYTAAEQVADFGSVPGSVDVRIAQLASGIGADVPLQATLTA
ncbi:baseplate multidomain protein megatron [Amorphus coralli]|uniref:baseplate multidomain protein megatron n=1 Tax=Amorphus coralli TaxID=340680 RepID=UPI00036504AB|nr:glycoside hydrolase/phage tail family protein [Amorphus coralli]